MAGGGTQGRRTSRRRRPAWLPLVLGAGLGELDGRDWSRPRRARSPSIGSALIDLAPSWAKDAAIALFGTNDKIALLVGIGIVLIGSRRRGRAGRAALAAVRARRRGRLRRRWACSPPSRAPTPARSTGCRRWSPGVIAAVALGVLMAAAARRRSAVAPIPQPDREHDPPRRGRPPTDAAAEAGVQRRTFLVWAAGTAAVGVLAAVGLVAGARAARTRSTVVRDALTLPAGGDAGARRSPRRPSSTSRASHR